MLVANHRQRALGCDSAIGDAPYDVIAAAKCQIEKIALRSGGFTDGELLQCEPIALYDDVSELSLSGSWR